MKLPKKFNAEFLQQQNKRLRIVLSISQSAEGLRVDRTLPNLSCRSIARDFATLNKWIAKTDPDLVYRKGFLANVWANRPPGVREINI